MDRFAERFLHVDMDAFFVEVERLHEPSLRGLPVIVGGLGPRGVVAAASYEAREFGVGSAMPMIEARKRCPQARYVAPDHVRYGEMSDRVFEILHSFTPLVEGLSVDEAFLDVAGLRYHYESAVAVGEAIRSELRATLGLPASVGVAATKFLAKLASEDAKPDGLRLVPAGSELAYLHPMPVRRLWGVGQSTHASLEALGIRTIGDLAAIAPSTLERRLGTAVGRHLARLAHGHDDRAVVVGAEAKSISVEQTFAEDLVERDDVERELLRLCDRLSGRLRRSGYAGRALTLKVRFEDFTTVTRSITLAVPIEHTPDLWEGARSLLDRARVAGRGVRLLGIGCGSLGPSAAPRQLTMEHPQRDAAAEAAERVRARFGDGALLPARLASRPARPTRLDGLGDTPEE